MNGGDDMIQASCVVGIMYHISDKFDEYMKRELKKRGIPIQSKHAALFMILLANNNKLEFKEVAHMWRKSKSTLCDIVSRYSDEGLIQRAQCSLDKRNVYVKLTPEGIRYGQDFDEIAHEFLLKTTEGLSREQVEELKNILMVMKKNLTYRV